MTRAQFNKHKTENSQEKFKNLTQADKRIVVGKLNNKVFVNITKPEYLTKQEKAGFDSKKLFNFKEIPQEIVSALKAAKIKKRHLKNKQVALQAYDIIQKALALHTYEIMNELNEHRKSISDSSFTSKNTLLRSSHYNQNPNEKEDEQDQEEEKDKSSDVNKSQVTNMKPCGVDTSNEEESGKKVPPPPPPPPGGKLPPPPPPPPPPPAAPKPFMQAGGRNARGSTFQLLGRKSMMKMGMSFGNENKTKTFLEELRENNANLKKIDEETRERRKQEKKNIDFSKKEQNDLSEQFKLMLEQRKQEFHNSDDEEDEEDEDDDDSDWASDFD